MDFILIFLVSLLNLSLIYLKKSQKSQKSWTADTYEWKLKKNRSNFDYRYCIDNLKGFR